VLAVVLGLPEHRAGLDRERRGQKEADAARSGFGSEAMPVGPVLPAVPTIDLGGGPQPIKWEFDFFAFFGSLVARIKSASNYEKADGDLLGIEGAALQPPDRSSCPPSRSRWVPGGMPQLEVPKGVFDGFDFQYKVGDGRCSKGRLWARDGMCMSLPCPVRGRRCSIVTAPNTVTRGKPSPAQRVGDLFGAWVKGNWGRLRPG